MKTQRPFETSGTTRPLAQRNITDDLNLQTRHLYEYKQSQLQRCQRLKASETQHKPPRENQQSQFNQ